MFIIELAFGDSPERLAARPAHRQRLQYLHDEGVVLMAGPFADESGSLIVVDTDDPAAVDRLIQEDDYFRAPGVTVLRRQRWAPFLR